MQVYNNHDGSTGKISTSKGNQIKMKVDGFWYKMDYLGYEGLAEYLSSELLAYTNIDSYVKYQMTEISLNGKVFNGCKSADFLNENEEIVTADKLFKLYAGGPVTDFLDPKKTLKERIAFFVEKVEQFTGIVDYGKELTKILEWDSFILNDDRHFNNIAFLYNSETEQFSPCVLFDNGAAFLSDTRYDYPLEKNAYGLMADVKSKPFSESFDKQVKACEELYGVQLKIDKDICISEDVMRNIENQYGEKIAKRISSIFEQQCYLSDYLCNLSMEEYDYERD